jgi:hypothetical protein
MADRETARPFATLSSKGLHLKVIACEVAAREFFHCAARSVNTLDIALKPQGLHDSSDACRKELQPVIDAVDPKQYAALFLGCLAAFAGWGALASRPIPRLIATEPDALILDVHSHTARSHDGSAIPRGSLVTIEGLAGTVLIVKAKK